MNTYNPTFNTRYEEIIHKLELCGFVPLVTVDNLEDVLPLVGALNAANIHIVEIAYRSSIAKEVIKMISTKCPTLTVGAGSILRVDQASEAQSSGAKFVTLPGCNTKVIDRCIELGLPVFPGSSNASDLDLIYERGLRVANFFPCEQLGGVDMLKALSAPYPFIRFIPTGGINLDNIKKYLSFSKVLCCEGTFLASPEELKQGKYDAITLKAREVVNSVLDLKMERFIIHTEKNKVSDIMNTVSRLTGVPYSKGNNSGIGIEADYNEKNVGFGSVVYSTPDIERTIYYLQMRGCTIDKTTIVRDSSHIVEVDLLDQAGGIGCKLIRR